MSICTFWRLARPFTCALLITIAFACRGGTPIGDVDDPDRRLVRAECQAAVAHAIELLAADPASRPYADGMRRAVSTHVDQCLATATVRDQRCLMRSRTATELGLCPVPGQHQGSAR